MRAGEAYCPWAPGGQAPAKHVAVRGIAMTLTSGYLGSQAAVLMTDATGPRAGNVCRQFAGHDQASGVHGRRDGHRSGSGHPLALLLGKEGDQGGKLLIGQGVGQP